MPTNLKILLLGATGYIGGSVLDTLLKHPKASQFDITAYIRSEEKAKKAQSSDLKTFSGTLSEVENAASKASVIFNCAASDDLPLTEAILAGAKKAYSGTNVPSIIIHTSGSGIVADKAMGEYASDKVYDDADEATLDALPITSPHRKVDIPLAAAHKEGYVRTYVIAPPLIYGTASGRLVDSGVQNPVPSVILVTAQIAVERGTFGLVGPAKNLRSTIEIHDLARLYITLFDAVSGPGGREIPGGNAYYGSTDGYVVARDYLTKIAKTLHEFGLIKTAEITQYTQKEMKKWPILPAFGINARMTDSRSRSLGWKPVHNSADFLSSIREGVELMVSQKK